MLDAGNDDTDAVPASASTTTTVPTSVPKTAVVAVDIDDGGDDNVDKNNNDDDNVPTSLAAAAAAAAAANQYVDVCTFPNAIMEVPDSIEIDFSMLPGMKRKRHKKGKKKKRKRHKAADGGDGDGSDGGDDDIQLLDKMRRTRSAPSVVVNVDDDDDDDDDDGEMDAAAIQRAITDDPELFRLSCLTKTVDREIVRTTAGASMRQSTDRAIDRLLSDMDAGPQWVVLRLLLPPNNCSYEQKVLESESLSGVVELIEKRMGVAPGSMELHANGRQLDTHMSYAEHNLTPRTSVVCRVPVLPDLAPCAALDLQVMHDGERQVVTMSSGETLDVLLRRLEDEGGYDRNSLYITRHSGAGSGVHLNRQATPAQLRMNAVDLYMVELQLNNRDDGGDSDGDGGGGDDGGEVALKINVAGDSIVVRVKMAQTFGELARKLEKKYKLAERSLSLLFDGDVLDRDDTPAAQEMEDEDQLDSRIKST